MHRPGPLSGLPAAAAPTAGLPIAFGRPPVPARRSWLRRAAAWSLPALAIAQLAVLATALAAALASPLAAAADLTAVDATAPTRADFGRKLRVSADARRVADWVAATNDNGTRDFVLVDKRAAHVYVFDAWARLQADSPVLLGWARGDLTVPGIGDRPLALVRPEERTTPAGRFVAEPGVNAQGEDVVWVDYDAAVSMHRVRTGKVAERRLARLASVGIGDNRISYGCINLPVQFYEIQLRPRVHGGRGAVVYVLPEVLPLRQVFALTPG